MSEQATIGSLSNGDEELMKRLQDLREWHVLYCRKIRDLQEQKHTVECGEADLLGEIRDTRGEERLYEMALEADIHPDYVNYLLQKTLRARAT